MRDIVNQKEGGVIQKRIGLSEKGRDVSEGRSKRKVEL